jgi:flagellar hook protein FlgE
MGFQQGLAGLNAAARNLDVIGNNVANSGTVGFKSARAEFADVYATSVYGTGTASAGIGVSVSDLAQQFTQGDLATSSNALDIAINGGGFYRLSSNGAISYSRNGQFKLDKDGFIVNAQSMRLTGYPAGANGAVNGGVPQELRLDASDIPPAATASARIGVALNAAATAPTVAFDPADGTSYNNGTSIGVFDSLGREHALALYFSKAATPDNTWAVHSTVDGGAATQLGTMTFDGTGTLTSSPDFSVAVPATAGAQAQTVSLSLAGATQFGSDFSVSSLVQDGHATGRLAGFSVGPDGTILSRYTNGETIARGQVVLANFTNPQGLQSQGGNQWVETAESGQPLVGSPGSGTLGVLQAGAVESSNVDLTAELVNMITAQRVYQANAQTIKTNDQLLQTIVNLR